MILVQGCSFTEGKETGDPARFAWPVLLSKILEKRVVSLAESGKDNFIMHKELVTYLTWGKLGRIELPEMIVWQTTDHKRNSYYRMEASGVTQPNNLITQTTEYVERHAWHFGVGSSTTELVHRDENREIVSVQELGDSTYLQYELDHCVDIITLQTLCRTLGVKLVILNYNGQPKYLKGDPVFENIDRSNYVVYNSRYFGIHNQLIHMGFERFPCGHFDIDAHLYQADVVADFIREGKQLEVLTDRFRQYDIPIFDYVSDIDEKKQ